MNKHLPIGLYTADQVRELDRLAIEQAGIPGIDLMQRAGTAAFNVLQDTWPRARRLAVYCGTGNNGGDGYVLAHLARQAGLEVQVFQVGDSSKTTPTAAMARQTMEQAGLTVQALPSEPVETDVVIDALLGTGLQGEVRPPFREAILQMNHTRAPVLALDIPSGLNADTGQVLGVTVRAQLTICFIGLKQGLFTAEGPDHAGQLAFHGLQVPASVITAVKPSASRITFDALAHRLAPRPRCSHKGDFGHVLIIGGDQGMAGAALLAGRAALRSGAGWVSVATRPEHAAHMWTAQPELMCHPVKEAVELTPLLQKASVVAVGPGLGQSDWSRQLFGMALECGKALVIDADALNQLAREPVSRPDWILTPHAGEAGRLLGSTSQAVQADRFAAVRALQSRYGGVVVLKGNGTLVSDGEDPVGLSSAGNPGMATGGMGDVLTGIIAGLLAQQHDDDIRPRLQVAARLGVSVHGMAANQAARSVGERGLLPSDIINEISDLVNP
jgi:NAD(P)H-hydrate epimerase